MKTIIQHGIDGFGHQIHGLFSCLILHNIDDFYFDGFAFVNKKFRMQHLNKPESKVAMEYLKQIGIEFIKYYNQEPKIYKNIIHSHEVYKIPSKTDEKTIYSIDNAYYFDKLNFNETNKTLHKNNIEICKNFFINNKLPENRLNEKNIVIHFRLGDAMTTGRKNTINKYNELINKLPFIFKEKYADYTYYLHSDGNIDFFTNILELLNLNYFVFPKNTSILQVFSDFIHASIFVAGTSGLSVVCTFLGDKELIIINDETKHSVPESCIRIKDYISKNEVVKEDSE